LATFIVVVLFSIPNALSEYEIMQTFNPIQRHAIANALAAFFAVISPAFFKEHSIGIVIVIVLAAIIVFCGLIILLKIIKVLPFSNS
jgi:uncharacterized membrane protein YgaE (UPF0421/DUF939 family)